MVNYQNGKIYKIESNSGGLIYYGSTTKQYLSQRMDIHRSQYKRWLNGKCNLITSIKLFEEYGIENCKIVLVEAYPCNSKDELRAKEAHYIRNFECVNKNIPDRTYKEYYADNKNKIAERKKKYYADNKDKIKEYQQNNKNKIAEYQQNNKNKINEHRRNIKLNCVCGSCFRKYDRLRHEKTIKHIEFMKTH